MTDTIELQNTLWACIVGVGIGALCLISPLIPLGIMLGAAFAIAMLRKPTLMCYVVITAVVFLSGMRRGGLIPLFIPNEPILILTACISYFVIIMKTDNPKIEKSVLAAIAIFTVGTSLIPLVAYKLRDFPLSTSDIFGLLAPLQYLIILLLFAYLPKSEQERHNIIQWMLFCASIVAFIGILEALHVGFVQNLLHQWYPSKHLDDAAKLGRVTSVLGAWNSLGNFLLINLIIVLSLQGYTRSRLHNLNTLIALFLCTACLLASGSYASLIGLFISLVVMKWFNRTNFQSIARLGIVFAIAAVPLYPAIAARVNYQFREGGLLPETLAYRFEVWQNVYIPMIEKNPWWGISPTFRGYTTWPWAESQYLFLLFRSGMPSLVAHAVSVFILMGWSHRRIHTSEGLDGRLSIALFSILASFTIMGFTNEVFTSSGAMEYIWMILGLTAAERTQVAPVFTWKRLALIPDSLADH